MNSCREEGSKKLTSKTLESGKRTPVAGLLAAVSFYGLLATIALMSVPYGGGVVWHKSLLILFITVIAGFRIIDCFLRGSFRVVELSLLTPLLGILGLAVIQTLQWPATNSAISVDPYETRSFVFIFGALIVAAEVLFFYTTSARRVKYLVALVIVVGAGSAVFGLSREIYFDAHADLSSAYSFPEQGFAQFINRNHFMLLIEMAFGLLLGIILKGELSERVKLICWILVGIMGYAAIAANSRGGLFGMAALILFAILLHTITREGLKIKRGHYRPSSRTQTRRLFRKVSVATGLMAMVFGLIVFMIAFVGGDAVVTRIEKLKGEFETVSDGGVNRRLIWNSTLKMIESEPVVGIGFGGYSVAIPRFDTSGGKYRLQQAHNDYLEILANGGIIGFALFAWFGVIVVRRISKNIWSRDRLRQASCFGAAIGIFGVLIHSFVDFGLHVNVNAFMFAVLVVIATANVRVNSEFPAHSSDRM